ncbi:MAG: 1-acyl-sn-glycerol-3-phosphate acyltransferase [Candidatus Hydrogenedentota bacterium]|nr:MAG: 1-acyl-sn-glycerol-3-phosphate acyltransferase [Candidatus Hydrogenedentota bacterium]
MKRYTKQAEPLYLFCRFWVRLTLRFLLRLNRSAIRGAENVPETGGVIVASNHASVLDPPVIASAVERPLTYLAKEELFKNRLIGWFIGSLGAFPVKRGRNDRQAMRAAIDLLKEGRGVVFFPEGTRSRTGEIGRMKPGFVLVAAEAEVPVVPAYIDGTFEAWPRGGKFHPAKVRVAFGEPMETKGMERSGRAYREFAARFEAEVRRLREEMLEAGGDARCDRADGAASAVTRKGRPK